MKRFMTLLVIMVLAAIAIYNNVQSKNNSPDQLPKVGFTAPYFTLKGLDGGSFQVDANRQKPLVVNFWASWCGPCRAEAPDLRQLFETYHDRVDFYAVNLTVNDQMEQAKAFVQEYKLPFPILLDETGEVAQRYEVVSIPTTYVIDKNGIIRKKVIGVVNPAAMKDWLDEISK